MKAKRFRGICRRENAICHRFLKKTGKYGMKTNGIPDYIVGADIAAFERVADGIRFH